MIANPRRVVRNLPLFWKLLIPFLTLAVLAGAVGGFLVVRELTARAQEQLDRDLARRLLDARSTMRSDELYLLESVNFASNINGMAEAAGRRDRATVGRLTRSVAALKRDLDVITVVDTAGRTLAQNTSATAGSVPDWSREDLVRTALRDRSGSKQGGIVSGPAGPLLVIVAPVCAPTTECSVRGATIAALRLDRVVGQLEGSASDDAQAAILDVSGEELARSGGAAIPAPGRELGTDLVRRRTGGDSGRQVVYGRLDLQGRPVGAIAVALPTAPAFEAVRAAAWRLALLLVLAIGGVVTIGAVISRRMLAQVRPLIDTSRRLGQGDLDARVPVLGDDELGELARRVNEMAEQLSASYETLESRVDQRTEEVQRLLRDRTEFFASLSHELRTPLAVILGQCALLMDHAYAKDRAATTDASAAIRDSAQQVLGLVNEVLDVAKAEAGRIDLEIEPVVLGELVDELLPTIRGLARRGELELRVDVPAHLPAVSADPQRLREVLLNLVDNAVKYTPQGGRIDVSAAHDGDSVCLVVADTGVGIPDDVGDRIFEPFYRVKGTRTQRGEDSSGLGLALTKRLVEAHGGALGFASEVGRGTTFRVTLPTVQSTRTPTAGPAPESSRESLAPSH